MHTKKRTFNIFNRLNVREGNKGTVEKKDMDKGTWCLEKFSKPAL